MNGKFCGSRWLAVLLALALAACDGGGGGGGGAPGDVTPPAIVSTLPVDDASGVARTTAVTATFSEAVAPASVNASTFSLSSGALPVSGSLTVDGPIVTFTPSAPLALGALFIARFAVGVTDLAGNALAAPFIWNFTTEAAPWPGTRQLGTTAEDTGNAVAVDGAGNVYVAGSTAGDLDGVGFGDPLFGGTDFFLAKFDPAGNLLFTRQLGTVPTDEARGVAVDGEGNIYVAGNTSGDLDGTDDGVGFDDPLFGGVDFFLAKFDPAGNLLFTRQLGTVPADEATGVAVDGAGNIYVTGSTAGDLDGTDDGLGFDDPLFGGVDFFLAKFDPAGNLLFTRQLGTVPTDEATGVAVDGTGNIYVTGSTAGDLDGAGSGDPLAGGVDFFLAKFAPSGNLLGTRQLGTVPADEARGVAVDDAGNVYVAGSTAGDMDGVGFGDPLFGGTDFFLAKFDPDGSFLGTRQLGTTATDEANGVAVDGAGNIYVAGSTAGDLDGVGFGDPLSGGVDLFLAKFDPAGSLLFTRQLGTVPTDEAFGVAAAGLPIGGNVFVVGETSGDLDGIGVGDPLFGGVDFFLARFDPFGNLQ